jgi:hypothetical protein
MQPNFINNAKQIVVDRIAEGGNKFNRMSAKGKRLSILSFGICVSGISLFLIIQALREQENRIQFKAERIAMPYDIFMKDTQTVSEDRLVPVGKMKGEIDGEFESFYVAVDGKGLIYINREIEYNESAYDKSEAWKQISREKLTEFEKELHFIPSRSRGLRR